MLRLASLEDSERAGATDIADLLPDRRTRAQAMLLVRLSDSRYLSLLNRVQVATEEPRITARESPAKMAKQHRRARRRARQAPASTASNAELHGSEKR
jgi:hypothetical protein